MSSNSFALSLYLAASRRGMPLAHWLIRTRFSRKDADKSRLPERLGRASIPRPEGRLIWFHAVSVGESLALLEILRRLVADDKTLTCLITTGTSSAAELLKTRLPDRVIHQFIPIDVLPAVTAFLDHWRPDLAVWSESEFWPTLIVETSKRSIPMISVNARISERSANRWRWFKGTIAALLNRFNFIQTQDLSTADHFEILGMDPKRLEATGSLKEGSEPLPCDEKELARLTKLVSGRPVWVAASTHEGEEIIAEQAYRIAERVTPRLLMILVPRHVERADAILAALPQGDWNIARRSLNQPLEKDTDIYLADTMGELGLWYRLASVAFVGGSLVPVGGHNPFEPATLGSAILHGPHVFNFTDSYERFTQAKAARLVQNAQELGEALADTLQPDKAALMAAAAWTAISDGADVTDKAIDLIRANLPMPLKVAE